MGSIVHQHILSVFVYMYSGERAVFIAGSFIAVFIAGFITSPKLWNSPLLSEIIIIKSPMENTLRAFFCSWGRDLLTCSWRKPQLHSARAPSRPYWAADKRFLGSGTLKSGDVLQNYKVLKFLSSSSLSPCFNVEGSKTETCPTFSCYPQC